MIGPRTLCLGNVAPALLTHDAGAQIGVDKAPICSYKYSKTIVAGWQVQFILVRMTSGGQQ